MIAIEAVTTTGATAALCQSVGLARATLYRRRQPARSSTPTPRAASARALGPAERQAVLDVLHSERFVDQSPAEVQATLLEEQTYLCSTRTMYRILDAAEEVRGGPRFSDRLLRWSPDPTGGIWNATQETELPG